VYTLKKCGSSKVQALERDFALHHVRLVFVLLAMPWVQEAARPVLAGIPDTVAVVTGDWKDFGRLPVVEWGKVRLAAEHL
jgi:hypothetical protein